MQTQFQFRIKHTTVARHFKRSKYIILFPKMGQFSNKKKSLWSGWSKLLSSSVTCCRMRSAAAKFEDWTPSLTSPTPYGPQGPQGPHGPQGPQALQVPPSSASRGRQWYRGRTSLSTCPCCLHCRTRQLENKHSSVIIEVETWDGRRGESFTYFLIFLWFHVSVYVSAAVTSKTWMVRFQL